MYQTLLGERTFVATGGKAFDSNLPAVVFLHGSGLDHRCWSLQTRWFAFHGFSVVAPDLPGHSLSAGTPLESIESMSQWLWQVLDELGVERCSLVGHSQGALVALQAAADQPARVRSLSLVGTAPAIAVNPVLLSMAAEDQPAAVDAMLQWGFGNAYQFGRSQVPGQAPMAIGSRIMGSNPLHTDLRACQQYTCGPEAAARVTAPAQLILAGNDRMTPVKLGLKLLDHLPDVRTHCILEGVGHMIPMEAPDDCLHHLRAFIAGTVNPI